VFSDERKRAAAERIAALLGSSLAGRVAPRSRCSG